MTRYRLMRDMAVQGARISQRTNKPGNVAQTMPSKPEVTKSSAKRKLGMGLAGATGFGAAILTKHYLDYRVFHGKLPPVYAEANHSKEGQQEKTTSAKMIIIGRQSPNELISTGFGILELPDVGTVRVDGKTRLYNEGQYEHFMPGVDYQVTQLGSDTALKVTKENLDGSDWRYLDPEKLYAVGVARKPAFGGAAGEAYHGAIALQEYTPDMDKSNMVIMTGAEVVATTEKTNKQVCKTQPCNMISSNCYSAMITWLANASVAIDNRTEKTPADDDSLKKISNSIHRFSEDQAGLGVVNNPIVVQACTETLNSVFTRRGLMQPTENKGLLGILDPISNKFGF